MASPKKISVSQEEFQRDKEKISARRTKVCDLFERVGGRGMIPKRILFLIQGDTKENAAEDLKAQRRGRQGPYGHRHQKEDVYLIFLANTRTTSVLTTRKVFHKKDTSSEFPASQRAKRWNFFRFPLRLIYRFEPIPSQKSADLFMLRNGKIKSRYRAFSTQKHGLAATSQGR